jgi:hypothetical protein
MSAARLVVSDMGAVLFAFRHSEPGGCQIDQAVAFLRRYGLLRNIQNVSGGIDVKTGEARGMNGFGKRAEFLQPLSGNLFVNETSAEILLPPGPASRPAQRRFARSRRSTLGRSRLSRLGPPVFGET